jgi:hypothetical protein
MCYRLLRNKYLKDKTIIKEVNKYEGLQFFV